jgi:hypothetical protein
MQWQARWVMQQQMKVINSNTSQTIPRHLPLSSTLFSPCGFAAADVAYDAGVALAAAQTLRAAFSGTTPHESVTTLISALESGNCHNLETAVSANRSSFFNMYRTTCGSRKLSGGFKLTAVSAPCMSVRACHQQWRIAG